MANGKARMRILRSRRIPIPRSLRADDLTSRIGQSRGRGDGPQFLPLRQQVLQVEAQAAHVEVAVGAYRPGFARAVPAELDTVAVVVAQVERLADTVVAGAVEL